MEIADTRGERSVELPTVDMLHWRSHFEVYELNPSLWQELTDEMLNFLVERREKRASCRVVSIFDVHREPYKLCEPRHIPPTPYAIPALSKHDTTDLPPCLRGPSHHGNTPCHSGSLHLDCEKSREANVLRGDGCW